ncbi:MAG: 3'-5' exonuclease, partial [Chlamydiota bacterium]|nr:3'-5' exonuclease [Chlamydiota bacterium]
DTNYAQYCFIEMLSRRYRNICVVGDPDQSIYGWRGADIGNILKFEEDNPEAVRVTLEQNYRSTKYILDAANHLVRNNRLRKEKNLWTDNEEGEPIGCYCGSNEYEEVDFVVHMIERLKRDRAIQYHDMVIFYRMHAISRVFEESLRRADIPYQIIGGIGFYQRKEVKDIIAYLRLIDGSSDPVSFKRIINIPPKGIGAVTINKIEGYAQTRAKNIMEVLEENTPIPGISAKLQQHLHGFASLISYFKKQKELLHLPDLIMHLIERINFFEELKKEDKVMADARIANVKELVSAAEEYVLMHEEADLSGFLEGVVLATDLDKLSESDDSISLMTLHNAKGLEFEVVFMVALEDGFFPHGSAFVDDEELEEERRLCYVGMTRAKKKLLMSYSDSRMIYGRRTMTQPSRFLREIPENYMVSQSLFGSDIHHQANTGSSLGKVNSSLKFDYDIGQKVLHPVFGVGEIMELGREDNAVKVRINFENIPSSKWLMAKYARLTPL